MSDFHQLHLAFDRGLLGNYIHHGVTGLCRSHGASPAASIKCNNWREMSWSELRRPITPLTLHQPLFRKASKLFGILCPPPTKTTAYQIHLPHRYDANASLQSEHKFPFYSFKRVHTAFQRSHQCIQAPLTTRPFVTVTQWIFMNKPTLFIKHHIRHHLNMSGQFHLKMCHDNDVVWGELKTNLLKSSGF